MTTEVVPAEKNLPAALDYSQYAGQGTENAQAGDYALPFVQILQKMSPQVDEATVAYIPNAKPGMIYETATGSLYDGKEGITVVPCYFRKDMVEWTPRESGGGFVKGHGWNEALMAQCTKNDKGRMVMENGNLLVDTKYHYVLILRPDGAMPAVISMTSTQLKRSRKWLSMMQMRKLTGKDGKSFVPPSFAYKYKLTTGAESNEFGSWYSWNIEMGDLITDQALATEAVKFHRLAAAGTVKVADPDAGIKDDIPF